MTMRFVLMRRGSPSEEAMVFDADSVTVGRPTISRGAAEVRWEIADDRISRDQCRFTRVDGEIYVEGLSKNVGTFLSRRRIDGPTRVGLGEEVRFDNESQCSIRLAGASRAVGPAIPSRSVRSGELEVQQVAPPRPLAEGGRRVIAKTGGGELGSVEAVSAARAVNTGRGGDLQVDVPEDMSSVLSDARRWQELGRPVGRLLRDAGRLGRARAWASAGTSAGALFEDGALLREYVQKSADARRTRRLRAAAAALWLVGAVGVGAGTARVLARGLELGGEAGAGGQRPVCTREAKLKVDKDVDSASDGAALAAVVREAAQLGCFAETSAEAKTRRWLAGQSGEVIGRIEGAIVSLASRPDGARVVVIGEDGAAMAMDRATLAAEPLAGGVRATRALWSDDNEWLVIGGSKGEVVILDDRSWPPQEMVRLEEHQQAISALAIDPGARVIASGDEGGVVRLWPLVGQRARQEPLGAEMSAQPEEGGSRSMLTLDAAVTTLVLNGRGDRLFALAGGNVEEIMIEGARLRRRGRLDAQQVSSLAVALDGQQVLTGDRHGRVLMFVEERGGGWRPRPLRRDQFVAPIVAAAFVPEIRGAVVVTEGRELVFFELDKKPREGEHNAYSFEQMAEIPRRLVVAGDRAVTRGESEAPEVWALGGAERRRAALARLDGVGGGAALEVASKRSYAWTGSIGGEVRAWNLDSGAGQGAAVFRDHGKSPIRGAALSRDDSRLASVGADGTVLVYELDGDRDAAPTRLDGLVVGATWSLSFSPEGRWLAAISEGEVLVWSMDQKASPPLRGSDDGISRLVWQDEVHLVSGGRGGIRVWEVVDGGLKVQRPLAPWGQVDYVATGAGLVGAVSSMEMSSRVQVWDKNGELMLDEPQMSAARAFVFGQEGELAVGFASGVVKSWRCAASPRCTLANTWDGAGVVALSFSSTGELVVGDEGGSVRRLGKDMLELEEPAHRGKGPVVAVAAGPEEVVWGRGRQLVLSRGKFDAELVSPVELAGGHRGAITQVLVQAGTVAVSVGEDNTVRVWPLSAERLAARAERAGSGP